MIVFGSAIALHVDQFTIYSFGLNEIDGQPIYSLARRILQPIGRSNQALLRNQFESTSLSIALSRAEGRERGIIKDQFRFFHIAMGSTGECLAILILSANQQTAAGQKVDQLAASLYRLIARAR